MMSKASSYGQEANYKIHVIAWPIRLLLRVVTIFMGQV